MISPEKCKRFSKQNIDVLSTFNDWKTMIWKHIKCLRTNNSLDFCSDEFNVFSKEEGIVRHQIVCRTLQQNGVA